jgi:methionine-gamma-lyase
MTAQSHRQTHLAGKALQPETLMLGYGYDPLMSEGAVKTPLFLTSTFVFPSADEGRLDFDYAAGRAEAPAGRDAGLVYSRMNNPNLQILEERLAVLEGAEACGVFASGMAAISTTLLAHVRPGETIVRSTPLYGGSDGLIDNVLSKLGILSTTFSDGLDEAAISTAITAAATPIAAFFVETPANPTNHLVDLALLVDLAKRVAQHQDRRPLVIVDNTYLGPLFQSPLAMGADLVVYSLTKYVGGHSDLVAGSALGADALIKPIKALRSAFGCQLDVNSAWMLTRSLETLKLRMEKAFDNADTVARWLTSRAGVQQVNHLGFAQPGSPEHSCLERQTRGHGATFSFEVAGGRMAAFRVLDALQVIRLAVSLGGTESLACHPATTTHSGMAEGERDRLGISEGLIRLSVGIEAADDLIADLDNALKLAGF